MVRDYNDDDWEKAKNERDAQESEKIKKIIPKKNMALIFETNDFSLHGVEKVNCCEFKKRKTLTIFYVSNPRPDIVVRHRALFLPDDPNLKGFALQRSLKQFRFCTP